MNFETLRLPNGLRVVYLNDPTIHTIHCGFLINAGSRDELDNEHGMAHLIEHCMFKGTKKRKAFHILTRLDSVGGEINAYTTKEETCIYASALKEHFDRASELLVDITFASSFPDKEIEKEKSVITDEINSYRDTPDEMLLDEFEEHLFPNHPLGRTVLGTEAFIQSFNRDSILSFVNRLYATDQIVFSCVGNVSPKKLMQFCDRVLSNIPLKQTSENKRILPVAAPFQIEKPEQVHQVHSLMGGQCAGLDSDERRTMVLLNNILGGPALNSRLNLNIREKFGYCYYIESSYNPYIDIGLFEIYFGTDKKYYTKTKKAILKEMIVLAQDQLTPRMLSAAKKQIIGQIALAQENRGGLMLSIGKSLLHFDRVDSFEEIHAEVEEITAAEILATAQKVFAPTNINTLAYFPEKSE
jgi:predicted Zn-dependent peptidase